MSERHRLAKRPDGVFGRVRLTSEVFVEELLRDMKRDASNVDADAGEVDPAQAPEPQPLLLDAVEAAIYARCHKNSVYAAVKRGDLATRRVGRLMRFTVADLDEWMVRS